MKGCIIQLLFIRALRSIGASVKPERVEISFGSLFWLLNPIITFSDAFFYWLIAISILFFHSHIFINLTKRQSREYAFLEELCLYIHFNPFILASRSMTKDLNYNSSSSSVFVSSHSLSCCWLSGGKRILTWFLCMWIWWNRNYDPSKVRLNMSLLWMECGFFKGCLLLLLHEIRVDKFSREFIALKCETKLCYQKIQLKF